MGYEKEIILIKDAKSAEFSALDLLNILRSTEWKETLSIIDRGNDFDWINAQNKTEFDQIILQLLEKEPNRRFPNALLIARRLEAMQRALSLKSENVI